MRSADGNSVMATLSVLTPSFNYAWCIEDAVRSVAKAGERVPAGWEVEHVVVDDGSQDQSSVLLERWESHIILERHQENRGQSHTLNRCLNLATGEWIAWLNADDFYFPWSFHDACAAFDDEVDIVYGDAVLVDQSARFVRLMAEHPFSRRTLRWWGTYLPVGTVFLRRSILSRLGWREDLQLLLDWDLWLRAADEGARFGYLQSPLAAARRHPAQESRQERPDRMAEKARVRREHGLPSRPWLWRALQRAAAVDHGIRKAASGGYTRQRRAAVLKDKPMRWFSEPEGWASVASLYERGYGRKQTTLAS
jgi:glycosyltransferase involved in cell wall biosynthesis